MLAVVGSHALLRASEDNGVLSNYPRSFQNTLPTDCGSITFSKPLGTPLLASLRSVHTRVEDLPQNHDATDLSSAVNLLLDNPSIRLSV